MNLFKDVLCALWLLLLMFVWGITGKAILYLGAGLSGLFSNDFFMGFAIFLIIFPMPVTIFAYIHYVLWGKADTNKPKWIASNASMHEATWQWFIAVVASIVAVIMLSLASVLSAGTLNPAYLSNERELNLFAFLVWCVVSTLMFRWKRLWAKKAEAKRAAKLEAKRLKEEAKKKTANNDGSD